MFCENIVHNILYGFLLTTTVYCYFIAFLSPHLSVYYHFIATFNTTSIIYYLKIKKSPVKKHQRLNRTDVFFHFIKVIFLNNTAFGVATKSNHAKHLRPTHQTMLEFVFLQRLLLMYSMNAAHPVPNHPARYK
jgi:hypothetical protein